MTSAGAPELRIRLLGDFEVRVDGVFVPAEEWRRKKPAGLLKLLALAPGRHMHREQLMDALWPDLEPDAAGANLRKALYHARRALDCLEESHESPIAFDGDVVALPRYGVWIDVEAFRSGLASGRRTGSASELLAALDLYRDGLLPMDMYEEWAQQPGDQLRLEYLGALEDLVGALEAQGDLDRATEAARRLVETEPLREESHVVLMRIYALSGRRNDAIRQYEHLAKLLDEEVGSEPGAETQKLFEEIRARQANEPELTGDLWERVGDLRMLSGDAGGAAKAFGLALEAGGNNASMARFHRKSADAWLMQHRPDAAELHLNQAEALVEDPAERARLLRCRANLGWEQGNFAAAQEFATQALQAATAAGTAEDVAAAHEALAIVSHFRGEWRDGLSAEIERLASDEATLPQLSRVFDIHHCVGQFHLYGDELSASVEGYARRILDRAEESGAARAQEFAWCLLGETLLLQGRWEEAAGCLDRSCAIQESLGSRTGALPWQRRAELAVCRGKHEEAETYIQRASAIATVSSMASHAWGRIYATIVFSALEQGDTKAAVLAVEAAAKAAGRYGSCPTCSALLNPLASEAYSASGDTAGAGYYAESAAKVGAMFNSSAWQAMAESAFGSACVAQGDTSGAADHFVQARSLYEKAGQPFWAKRSARMIQAVGA